jgi:hypothetical protein
VVGFAFAQVFEVIMDVRPLGLRRCAALALTVVVAIAGLACHKSKHSTTSLPYPTIDLTGTVTFTRAPLVFNSDGVPTGVTADPSLFTTTNPARGIVMRVFQKRVLPNSDYTTSEVWTQSGTVLTGSDGTYSITGSIEQGFPTFLEIVSTMTQPVSPASVINIIADPKGVYSSTLISDRSIYVLRRGLDGSVIDPTLQNVPVSSTSNVTLNILVGMTDAWQVVPQRWWVPAQPAKDLPVYSDVVNAGSRILAPLDTAYTFTSFFGNCVPTSSVGILDLHYRPGLSAKRGTFVEFNSQIFPKSYDGSNFHYFGSISGGGVVDGVQRPDDAFDTGILNPILARNNLYGQRRINIVPSGFPAGSLAPDLALAEGLADVMAAALQNSPFLPGADPANHYSTPRDIRVFANAPNPKDNVFSAPAISALTWDLALINAKVTSPGNYTTWKTVQPINLLRFYTLRSLVDYDSSGNATTVIADCPSLRGQLARLQEAQTSSDASDLASFFPDSVLIPLCARFGFTWTTAADAILPHYTTNYGADPNTLASPFPGIPFTMSAAQTIPQYSLSAAGVEQVTNVYPNNSKGEVSYARFSLGMDAAYTLKVSSVPPLPEGAYIELLLDGDVQNVYRFSSTLTSIPNVTLKGNPSNLTAPTWHTVRVRMLSPTTLVSDTQVTLKMERTNQ